MKLMHIRPGSGACLRMLLFTNRGFIRLFRWCRPSSVRTRMFYASILNIPFYPCLYTPRQYLLSKDAADRGAGKRRSR